MHTWNIYKYMLYYLQKNEIMSKWHRKKIQKSALSGSFFYNFIQSILKHYDSYHFHKNSNSYFPLDLHLQNIPNDKSYFLQLSMTWIHTHIRHYSLQNKQLSHLFVIFLNWLWALLFLHFLFSLLKPFTESQTLIFWIW